MSVQKLPSGRWRAQISHQGRNVSVSKVIGGTGTYRTKKEAKAAREKARALLRGGISAATVGEWHATWTTDPLWRRPKASTDLHNAERTRAFVDAHCDTPIRLIDDLAVARWLAGGKRNGQVPALRAMFNDAASAKAGRLVDRNPFAGLGIKRTRGNRDKQPPPETMVRALVHHAALQASPAYSAWLQVAAYTGLRPGELDALTWPCVDFTTGRIHVIKQWNAKTRTFTLPKNGLTRFALLTPPARTALEQQPHDREFCFESLRGTHFTPSSRASHWKATRAGAAYTGTPYLAGRHFAGWYMTNVLLLPSEDVAIALGHTDGGELVRALYGHRDVHQALDRVQAAYERVDNVHPIKREDAG